MTKIKSRDKYELINPYIEKTLVNHIYSTTHMLITFILEILVNHIYSIAHMLITFILKFLINDNEMFIILT